MEPAAGQEPYRRAGSHDDGVAADPVEAVPSPGATTVAMPVTIPWPRER